ncbi:hypothetical protein HPP92_025145 [Vanilla planifolia]|uniref:Uncharacterized protein n=1 Tax=Vanilla planifolia TaxID=51239 RepID=A0A835PKE8_VANPL|nr:hypothetical protein HPP92_025145 [Vanilla planifolia]
MVLWEITAATAYFLGLKRTYKIVLRLQRRLVGENHPKIRQFMYRRTRAIFEVAVKVHKSIQQRDLEAGRNLGNWILRFLDHMKPSAQIRSLPGKLPHKTGSNACRHSSASESSIRAHGPNAKISNEGANGRQLFSSFYRPATSFPTVMMIKPRKNADMSILLLSALRSIIHHE